MSDPITDEISFELDGRVVQARSGETIWQVADRQGIEIPHLCYSPAPGYRPDGNCRACMVEIEGERVLSASCIRQPKSDMRVTTRSPRAENARRVVFELLLADQPRWEETHDPGSRFWQWTSRLNLFGSRFPGGHQPAPDRSHPAIAVYLDACISCGLCTRACREVQVNDVIGMAGRGAHQRIVFDLGDPMGQSSCVGCGECVQACPTGALLPASVVDESGRHAHQADHKVDSLCPYCGVGCQVAFHVERDRILFVEGRDGPANRGRLCVKGRYGFDYIHHPGRLTVPLIRKEGIPKGDLASFDPRNPDPYFRAATWEEALDRAAAGLRRIRDDVGSGALAGFGSAKGSNEEAFLFQKLVRTGFGNNNVDHCTRLCHASSVAALMETIGSGAVTASFSECRNSDVIIVIGANPTVNHPVAATFIKNAARRGATLIVIDPRRQALSRHARFHLAFKPGTDVALLNSLIHVIVNEGLHDEAYVAAHTEGFEQLRERVAGFSPEAMAAVCGVEAETLRAVARVYANARAGMIFWGMGISQHVHGTDNARCLIALALITGQIGRPGTGLHPLRGQNNVQGASDAGLIPMVFPDYHPVDDDRYRRLLESTWGATLDSRPGLTVVEIVHAILEGKIRGMYILGENPAMSDPDLGHAREAIARLDHLVVQEIFLTETAALADVVLPAAAFPEKTGSFTNTDRRVQLGRQVFEPPGEARQDWEIVQEIACRLGLNWAYRHPRDVFDEMRGVMPSLKGITWDRLEREGSVTYPCDGEDQEGHDVLFGDRFPTSTGRGKLVPAGLVPPDELPDAEYPMVLTTGRLLEHWHTGAMTRRASVLDSLEPEAIALLSPRVLTGMQCRPGERVRVSTRRGSIELATRADGDVPEGMIFIPFCFAEAAANLLTNPALDPFAKIPEFKFCAARIEKTVDPHGNR